MAFRLWRCFSPLPGYWWPKRTFLFWAKLSIHTCFDCIQIITAVVISSPQLNCSLKPLPPFSLTLLKIIIVIRIEAACVGNVANSVIELTQADSVHFFHDCKLYSCRSSSRLILCKCWTQPMHFLVLMSSLNILLCASADTLNSYPAPLCACLHIEHSWHSTIALVSVHKFISKIAHICALYLYSFLCLCVHSELIYPELQCHTRCVPKHTVCMCTLHSF